MLGLHEMIAVNKKKSEEHIAALALEAGQDVTDAEPLLVDKSKETKEEYMKRIKLQREAKHVPTEADEINEPLLVEVEIPLRNKYLEYHCHQCKMLNRVSLDDVIGVKLLVKAHAKTV